MLLLLIQTALAKPGCELDYTQAYPQDGATGVPLDVELIVIPPDPYSEGLTATLTDAAGDVTGELSHHQASTSRNHRVDAPYARFEPEQLLEAETAYEYTLLDSEGATIWTMEFTTGSELAEPAPMANITSIRSRGGLLWISLDTPSESFKIQVLDRNASRLQEAVALGRDDGTGGVELVIGEDDCGYGFPIDREADMVLVSAKNGAFDYGPNPGAVRICGCATTGPRGGAPLALLGLLLLRRRR